MKTYTVQTIGKGFYTDGATVYERYNAHRVIAYKWNGEENDTDCGYIVLATGMESYMTSADVEVRKCKAGESFYNGKMIINADRTATISVLKANDSSKAGKGYEEFTIIMK